ncbi:MAG: DUF4419 domain-containing protein [Nostoc desertorum CM1-VF14]|nr:DUF4419 domain-containing protein [Nostoc desertorum CM1-VF14]
MGLSQTSFLLITPDGQEHSLELLAGFTGVHQDPLQQTLQPEIGWAMRERNNHFAPDFTGANLRGTNFSNAKAGLRKGWASFLVCVSWLLSGISGFFLAITGGLIVFVFNSSTLETLAMSTTGCA